jgi:hypothetical protein
MLIYSPQLDRTMPAKKINLTDTERSQFSRFVETARKLGCDEDKGRFEKSLGNIAAYKPPKKPKTKKAAK